MSTYYGKGRSGYHIRLAKAESASAHGGQVGTAGGGIAGEELECAE